MVNKFMNGIHAAPRRVVYFLMSEANENIKIGRTGNIKARLNALQGACSEKISLLATIACDSPESSAELEKKMHHRFANSRIQGEWFRLTPDLEWYLRNSLGCETLRTRKNVMLSFKPKLVNANSVYAEWRSFLPNGSSFRVGVPSMGNTFSS